MLAEGQGLPKEVPVESHKLAVEARSPPLTSIASSTMKDIPTRSTEDFLNRAWGMFRDQVGTIISATVEDTPTRIADRLLDSAWERFKDLVSQHKSENTSEAQHESVDASEAQDK